MAHRWEIRRNRAGEYVAFFLYNAETIWWSEGYSSKQSALNAIESVKKNSSVAEFLDSTQTDPLDDYRNLIIPASDRVVELNHNSKEFADFEKAFKALSQKIAETNNFGQLSDDEVEAARSEVSFVRPILEVKYVRPSHIWQVVKSTLLWIAEKVGDATVGMLVAAVLGALAKLFGFIV